MENNELTDYLGQAARRLVANVAKNVLRSPRQAAFMAGLGRRMQRANATRARFEAQGEHVPVFLIASIADTCNLACKGCYARANGSCASGGCAEEGKTAAAPANAPAAALPAGTLGTAALATAATGSRQKLTPDEWNNIFEQARALGVPFILLAGGEPLLETETLQRAAEIKDIAFPVFTNGTLLQGETMKLFEENRNLIPVISVEGDQAATDDRRGDGVYEAVFATMARLQGRGMLFGASVTVTAQNRQEVTGPAFLDTLAQKGCGLVFYVEYVPVDGESAALALDDDDRRWMEAQMAGVRGAYPGMVFLSFPGDEEKLGGCLAAGRGFFHISPYGDAEPCPFAPYAALNLRTSTVRQVLTSDFFAQVRKIEEEAGANHLGGCVLFAHSHQVAQLKESAV